jgi:predicted Fe-Mo cluster-binding NifX family protein
MKVALTVWEDRISPVFDAARMLMIADIENGQILNRRMAAFSPEMSLRLSGHLKQLGIDVLICGAISRLPAGMIEAGGVQLIPFIGGHTEAVLAAYAGGQPIASKYSLPGCGRRIRRQKGRAFFLNQWKEVNTMPGGDGSGPRRFSPSPVR